MLKQFHKILTLFTCSDFVKMVRLKSLGYISYGYHHKKLYEVINKTDFKNLIIKVKSFNFYV